MEAVNLYVFDRCSRYKVISYAVKEGSKVKKDSILATYEIIGDQEATHYSLRSPSDGIVKSLLAAANVASSGRLDSLAC